VHQTSDWAAVAALVADGAAVALIPRLAQTTIPEGVVLRPLHGTAAARHVFAATRRGTASAPTTARALQCLQEVADQLQAVTR
jgi:DNA-binding transcriptional LysR family regulator